MTVWAAWWGNICHTTLPFGDYQGYWHIMLCGRYNLFHQHLLHKHPWYIWDWWEIMPWVQHSCIFAQFWIQVIENVKENKAYLFLVNKPFDPINIGLILYEVCPPRPKYWILGVTWPCIIFQLEISIRCDACCGVLEGLVPSCVQPRRSLD